MLKQRSARIPLEKWHFFVLFMTILMGFLHYNLSILIGAPFLTNDSYYYIDCAIAPWSRFGAHNPTGFSWVLFFISKAGFEPLLSLSIFFALRFMIVWLLILRVSGSFIFGLLSSLLITMVPDFLLLDFALWSESLFLTLMAAFALLIVSQTSIRLRYVLALLIFIALCEVRHTGIFLLPAIAASLAIKDSPSIKKFLLLSARNFICFFAIWMSYNFIRSGELLHPSKSRFECYHYLAAYNYVRYCDSNPELQICQADPERKWLHNLNIGAGTFIYEKTGTLQTLAVKGVDICQVWKEVSTVIVEKYPVELLRGFKDRLLQQLYFWDVTEIGEPTAEPVFPTAKENLNALAANTNYSFAYMEWIFLLCGVIVYFWSRREIKALLAYSILAAVFYAAGTAVNNPFIVMRYLAMPRFAMLLGLLVLLGVCRRWLTNRRVN